MEQPEEDEFEQLLGEIPRATSAPPLLEELQKAYGVAVDDNNYVMVDEDEVAIKPFTDIRLDEDYEEFYKAYSGVKKLPPPLPVENRQLYSDLPASTFSPKALAAHFSPFFNSLDLEYDSPRFFQRQHHHHHPHQHHHEQQQQQQQQQQEQQQFLEEVERQVQQVQKQRQQQQRQQQHQDQEHQHQHLHGPRHSQHRPHHRAQHHHPLQQHHSQHHQDGSQRSSHDEDSLADALSSMRFEQAGQRDGGSTNRDDQRPSRGAGSMGGRMGSVESSLDAIGSQGPAVLNQGLRATSLNGAGAGLDPYGTAALGAEYGVGGFDGLPGQAAGGLLRSHSSGLEGSGGLSGGAAQRYKQFLRRGNSSSLDSYPPPSGLDGYGLGGLGSLSPTDMYSAAMLQASRLYPSGVPPGLDLYTAAAAVQQQLPFEYDVAALLQAQQRAQQVAVLQQAQRLQLIQAQLDEEHQRQQRALQQQILMQQRLGEPHLGHSAAAHQRSASGGVVSSMHHGRSTSPSRLNSRQHASSPNHPSSGHPPPAPTLKSWRSNSADSWERSVPLFASEMGLMGGSVAGPRGMSQETLPGGFCRFYVQGYCTRGSSCPFLHMMPSGTYGGGAEREHAGAGKGQREKHDYQVSSYHGDTKISPRGRDRSRSGSGGHDGPSAMGKFPSNIPPSPSGARRKSGETNQIPNGYRHSSRDREGDGDRHPARQSLSGGGSPPHDGATARQYTNLEELTGQVFVTAKDQHGCRFLQRKFDEGGVEEVARVFDEILAHIHELMVDPFGNYLVQKLLEVCSDDQRMEVIKRVTANGELVLISQNMHGTRAVQKLVETVTGEEQVGMVVRSLQTGVVSLIKDLNGNHVIQRCLQRLASEDSQFIYDAASMHCVEIATHRHGCCVLQRCVDFASVPQRERLVGDFAEHALVLSQDPFGNYVVQYILDLNLPWATEAVVRRLEGVFPFLSQQKFASNVVEKCLKLAPDAYRARIVEELTKSPKLGQLLQDPYANYVVQSALTVSKGALHAALVDAIRPHIQALRSSPYGKRILARTNLKK